MNRTSKKKNKGKLKSKTKTIVPGLIHHVREEGKTKYLLKNDGELIIKPFIKEDNMMYRPKQDLQYNFPDSRIIEMDKNINYSVLLEEIIVYIKTFLEMPSESDYLILALWVFHTYLIDKFNTTPILYFYGVKETGKSRAGEVLNTLAFRSERFTSPTESILFRSTHYFKPTIIIDEITIWGGDGNSPIAQLIKTRYKRGLRVPRVNLNRNGEDQIENFDVFGPLVICTTEAMPETIESRCIRFLMQKNKSSHVEGLLDDKIAEDLRDKLTIFRANELDRLLPEVKPIARRRLNEILTPLYKIQMLINLKKEKEFVEAVQAIEVRKKGEESMSLENEIIEVLVKHRSEYYFRTSELRETLNENRTKEEALTDTKVGRCITRLGFKREKRDGGKIYICLNDGLLETLASQYGVDINE